MLHWKNHFAMLLLAVAALVASMGGHVGHGNGFYWQPPSTMRRACPCSTERTGSVPVMPRRATATYRPLGPASSVRSDSVR